MSTWNQHSTLFGAVSLTRSFLPHLRSIQSVSLVYIGSMGAYIGEYAFVPCDLSKVPSKVSASSLKACYLRDRETDLVFPSTGFTKSISKDVSVFKIMCMPANNVAFAPTTIDEYAGVQAAVKDRLEKVDHTPSGDPL